MLILLVNVLIQHSDLFTLNTSLSLTIMGSESGPKDMQGSARMQGTASRCPSNDESKKEFNVWTSQARKRSVLLNI